MNAFIPGFFLTLSLIVAIGAQNVFVLRQGVRREHVGLVVAICAASDALLILAGVTGVGRVLDALPWLASAARWAGVVFLLGYAAVAARRAMAPQADGLTATPNGEAQGSEGAVLVATRTLPVVGTTLALTWLNPHVYLDTVFLIGSVAASHGEDRWGFAAGAVLGSVAWFTALGFGARHLSRWLRTPTSWRILDAIIAVVMVLIAFKLAVGG